MKIANAPYQKIFDNNRAWCARMQRDNPDFFSKVVAHNKPEFLWIGCSDSRVPANVVMGLNPGEVFVHRNIANVVGNSDLNLLSVLQFAVEHLRVKSIILSGHYDCSGVKAAMEDLRVGLADNWIRHVLLVKDKHTHLLKHIAKEDKLNALCELNALEQVRRLSKSIVLQDAWKKGQDVWVHGCIYNVKNGHLNDLDFSINTHNQIEVNYLRAIDKLKEKYKKPLITSESKAVCASTAY